MPSIFCYSILALTFIFSMPGVLPAQQESANEKTQDGGQQVESQADGAEERQQVSLAVVRRLLRMLDADDIASRDSAEKQLIELGPAIIQFLPEVNSRTSAEMKIRLQRIRQSVESEGVESFFEASMITLSGKLKLSEAIESIEGQSGNDITIQGQDALESVEVELNVTDAPFWDVMTSVMEQANLRVNAYGSTNGDLALAPGGQQSGPTAFTSGPFHVVPVSVQSTLPFNSNIGGQLQISLTVTWEPRLEPVFMQIPMSSVQAKLEGDTTITATNAQAAPEIPLNTGGSSTQIDLQVQRPERNLEKIESLTGQFVVAVPSDRHKYEFKKFGNGARQSEKFGDVTVILEGSRRNGAVYEMRVLVEFGNAQGALDSFRGWILSNQAYLLDKNDKRLENVGLQTYAITPNAVGIAYLFQINGNPDDFTLVYESPASITKQTVRYELSDIELP